VEREGFAIVVFGDVVRSRAQAGRATAWLRSLCGSLNTAFESERAAPWDFTQGDELQGLLAPSANPIDAVLRAALDSGGLSMRWVIAAGMVDPGRGPATQRTGPAFLAARQAVAEARARREGLAIVTGDPETDVILRDIAPVLPVLLADLSARQRVVARRLLIDGRRQAEVADELGVSRPTVSVLAERGRVRSIGGLARGLEALLAEGMARSAVAGGGAT
jgi:hypothetical protein